VRGSSKCCGS